MRKNDHVLSKYLDYERKGQKHVNLCIMYKEKEWQALKKNIFQKYTNKLSTCKNPIKWAKVTYTPSYTHYPQCFYVNKCKLLW